MSKIAFIGGGNMARALIGGLIAKGCAPADFRVVEPSSEARSRLSAELGVAAQDSPDTQLAVAETIVLAVKPQVMRQAAQNILPWLGGQLVLTIAAGIRSKDLSRWLSGHTRIVRAMPNTPALINAGIAGLYAHPSVDAAGRAAAGDILAAVGEVLWFEDEAALDTVTAVSGSGPAYVFYFLEALQQAGVTLGLAPEAARKLAYATFSGAVRLAEASPLDPAALRAQVTSKGGTTEAAVAALDAAGVARCFAAAVAAAQARGSEMGEFFGRE